MQIILGSRTVLGGTMEVECSVKYLVPRVALGKLP